MNPGISKTLYYLLPALWNKAGIFVYITDVDAVYLLFTRARPSVDPGISKHFKKCRSDVQIAFSNNLIFSKNAQKRHLMRDRLYIIFYLLCGMKLEFLCILQMSTQFIYFFYIICNTIFCFAYMPH